MKLLILGAKGNLGTAFLSVLSKRDDIEAIAWDKDDIDVTDESLLRKKIVELKPTAIINLVAYNDVDRCETDEEAKRLAFMLNADVVESLGSIALDTGALLVHYSTDYVFAGDVKDGYGEAAEPAPLSVYGQSKAEGEKRLVSLSGRGLAWYLIRTSKLFGPKGGSPTAKPSFFEIMLRLSASQPEVKAVDEEKSCFTYTPDLAQATLDLIESGDGYGIYHFVNEGPATWFEAARAFFKKLDSPVSVVAVSGEAFPRPAKRPAFSALRNTKRPPLRPLDAALDEYVSGL